MSRIERFPTHLPVPLSKAVRAGGFLFLSGQLALDANGNLLEGGIQVQTKVVLENISGTLDELGASMADVVKVTVWLANFGDFAAFNEEYCKHFSAGLPARSTVEAKLGRGAAVEIEVQALDH